MVYSENHRITKPFRSEKALKIIQQIINPDLPRPPLHLVPKCHMCPTSRATSTTGPEGNKANTFNNYNKPRMLY